MRASNIRNGTFLTTQRPVLLHVLYIPLIEATATSSAPGVAWIMVGKQCARRGVLGFLRRDIGLFCGREVLVDKTLISPPQLERFLYYLVSYFNRRSTSLSRKS